MATKPTGFIEFNIVGDRHGVQHMLNSIDSALSPVGLAAFLHGDVGPWVKQRAADRFRDEGDDVTGKWAPLAASTVEFRENAGFEGAHPINKRTGELEAYITQGNVDVVAAPGVATMRYPSKSGTVSKALRQKLKTAQQGRDTPRTVARPVLGLNERDLAHVLTMLGFFVKAKARVP